MDLLGAHEERVGAHEERVGALEQTSGHINGGARYERSRYMHASMQHSTAGPADIIF